MSLLDDALALHATRLQDAAGETVTYFRGTDSVSVTAVVGESVFEEVAGDGEIRPQIKTVDFLLKPADLVLSGSVTDPQRGDRVQRSDGETFDVLPGVNGSTWQWSDARKTFLRIHSVRRVESQ